jgi:hypothetical protein
VFKKALGKEALCRVSKIKHATKSFFAECFLLPSVFCLALGKEALCRVSKIKHATKRFFAECFLLPSVFCLALGKKLICRVPEKKHSAEYLAFGKESNSGSESSDLIQIVRLYL